jgi:hypothetical protein
MKKYLSLILGLAVLIAMMRFIVIPLVMEVVTSDLFLVQSKDEASQLSVSTPMTAKAFGHCNTHIKSEVGENTQLTFPDAPLKAWSFGNYQYIVHAEFNANGATKKYACRITYDNGDDLAGADDFNNWTIDGISGLEGL